MTPVTPVTTVLPTGLLISSSVLHSDAFKVLATFVALNTLMYATLALMKMLPKGYAFTWFSGRNRRTQSRSIYPESSAGAPPADAPQVPHQRGQVDAGRPAPAEDGRGEVRRRPESAEARPRDPLDDDVRRLLTTGLRTAGRTIPRPVAVAFPPGQFARVRRQNPSPRGPRR